MPSTAPWLRQLRHSREGGNDAIDGALAAATTLIPAKAGMMPSTAPWLRQLRHSREGGNDAIDGALAAATTSFREGGNDAIDGALAAATTVIPAEAGMMPSTPMRLSLLTVIPAKAGIHRCSRIAHVDAPCAGVVWFCTAGARARTIGRHARACVHGLNNARGTPLRPPSTSSTACCRPWRRTCGAWSRAIRARSRSTAPAPTSSDTGGSRSSTPGRRSWSTSRRSSRRSAARPSPTCSSPIRTATTPPAAPCCAASRRRRRTGTGRTARAGPRRGERTVVVEEGRTSSSLPTSRCATAT